MSPETEEKSEMILVGIGASAGGLEAMTALLRAIPRDGDRFALVFAQHLDPDRESGLLPLLARETWLEVVTVENGLEIRPSRLYVVPPGCEAECDGDVFRVRRRAEAAPRHGVIDTLLVSLARERGGSAVGVLLSGSGSDGVTGLAEIKSGGGIVLVQDPETAKFPGLPHAALDSTGADLVLPPADIGTELVRICRHPLLGTREERAPTEVPQGTEEEFETLFRLLQRESGVDFAAYKRPTIRRRLHRRMVVNHITDLAGYLRYVEEHPAELMNLFRDILIHVTRFFRDPEAFESLREHVYPAIVERARESGTIRVWTPGCATGEEPYSVAMSLLDYLRGRGLDLDVQVFATDVSERSVEFARQGSYPKAIEEDVGEERLRRFFTRVDGRYRIAKSVRDLCIFARQDLTRDPPFSNLDLVVCRNVLIYLGSSLQRKVLGIFHYALNPAGFLLVGTAETTAPYAELFSVVDKRHRIYTRKTAHRSPNLSFPVDYPRPVVPVLRGPRRRDDPQEIARASDSLLLDRYAPAAVVVDRDHQIVHSRGATAPFLELPAGSASLDILRMAREGLVHALRTALHAAEKEARPVRRSGLRVVEGEATRRVAVEVVPFEPRGRGPHYLVLLEVEDEADDEAPAGATKPADDDHVEALKLELHSNQQYLQSIIEDLEATNEELQSANEEILSSNEELQSTNEELDTAKEELQSTNEELHTVNEELNARNEELTLANSDLVNLLSSVQLAIVMVDGDLRIRRFTPSAERLLNLIASDVGRPIRHIKPDLDLPDLEEIIVRVIDDMSPLEREVRDRRGDWHLLRVRPYKSLENRIDGAVLALFDIDGVKRQEEELRRAREFARAVLEFEEVPVAVLTRSFEILDANPAFLRRHGLSGVAGRHLFDVGEGRFASEELRKRLDEFVAGERRTARFEAAGVEGGEVLRVKLARSSAPAPAEEIVLCSVIPVPEGGNE